MSPTAHPPLYPAGVAGAHAPLRLDGLAGLINRAIGDTLYQLALAARPDRAIVEVGSYRGKSTAYLAAGSLAGPQCVVYAIDPWDLQPPPGTGGRDFYEFAHRRTRQTFEAQLTEVGVRGIVVAHRSYSVDAAADWPALGLGLPVGLLYVDGDHTAAGVAADIDAWFPQLAPDAVVVFDDYGDGRNPGVAEAVDAAAAAGRLVIVDTPDRLAVTRPLPATPPNKEPL